MATIRDKLIETLTRLGERQVKTTPKRVIFSRQGGGFYFLGKAGGFRAGPTVVGSASLNAKNFLERHKDKAP